MISYKRSDPICIQSPLHMAASSSVCLMSKATSTKSWLWHRRLSHLNFGTINDLTKHDLVDGLQKFKYGKDHLCSACEWGKSKKASHPLKVVPSNHSKLELLHMDLCRPMRVASINGKRYNKTPYELLHGRKPNVEYFHMFGSLYYPTKERDDLGKMKPKAHWYPTLSGVDFGNHLEGFEFITDILKRLWKPSMSSLTSSQLWLLNMTSINSAAQQVNNHEDSPSTSSIIIEEHEAPHIVTTFEEQTSPISLNEADEFYQEDSSELDGNTLLTSYDAPDFSKAESSTALDPSIMHDTIEPKNIKEAMSDHSWIESMQDELHQFKRLDVWELVPRPDGKNIIVVKWL
ncbi:retrovirus-related pol polyprotein from transposon TNT 1-94 [Tanacetum coccineum]